MWEWKSFIILETETLESIKTDDNMKKECALKMNQMKLLVKKGFLKLKTQDSWSERAKRPYFLFLLGSGQHFFHVCNDVRDNSPKSGSNIHLLWIHDSHGVSIGVMEGEIFI